MNLTKLCVLGIGLALASCSKTHVYENNTPPADNSISELEISTYINRVYISLLGRKADAEEFSDAKELMGNQPGLAEREQLLDQLLQLPEYKSNYVLRWRQDLIEGIDSIQASKDMALYTFQLQDSAMNPLIRSELQNRVVRLQNLVMVNQDYLNGVIDWKGVIRRFIDNHYYDEINMGTENFVVSLFQHFLDRYPSAQELEDAKRMVDGFSGILFLQTGNSKAQCLDILFSSEAFMEGQIHRLYQNYIYRKATQDEVLYQLDLYQQTQLIQSIQRSILTSESYFKQ
ncbi:MAG: hypothetical protein EP332_11335 [Bacteroidetes bacterium]|nr:MAG: hypothetical protein EP332_11335 [Bacteroidota bacterium]